MTDKTYNTPSCLICLAPKSIETDYLSQSAKLLRNLVFYYFPASDKMRHMRLNKEETDALVQWFEQHHRKLPWRDTNNPYDTWISEIMLQQTRVEAVRNRFIAFKKQLPDIASLAAVDDDQLMKLWEGMGYYSRARSLKKCAIILQKDYAGKLPSDPRILVTLPGIGPYTAGAIASQAYGIPVPAVDGNVLRVMTRRLAITDDIRKDTVKKQITAILQETLDACIAEGMDTHPRFVSHFNQALMELGATICGPNEPPHCDHCPFHKTCLAHLYNQTDTIPFRSALKQRKIVNRTLLIIRCADTFLLQKRPDHGLLAGLYEFPGIDQWLSEQEAVHEAERRFQVQILHVRPLPDAVHIFSHVEWHMHAYELRAADLEAENDLLFLTKKELQKYAVPSAFKAYIHYYELED